MANSDILARIAGGLGGGIVADQRYPAPSAQPPLSKGQLIMGILADALAGAAGQPGQFAAQMNQRHQQEQEDVRWGRRLEQEQKIKAQYPDVSPMERDARAWAHMTQQERDAYGEMRAAGAADPDVVTTLPNGQLYAGPRSGLAAAIQGYAQGTPAKPVGKLTPIDGGPTQPASGGFRRY